MKNIYIFSVLFSLCIIFSCVKPEVKRPNVLLIMTDDQGWGDLTFHGNEQIAALNNLST